MTTTPPTTRPIFSVVLSEAKKPELLDPLAPVPEDVAGDAGTELDESPC